MKGAVVAVCGLWTEARIARGATVVTVAGGGNPAHLTAGIERAIADGAVAVISFGIAGGLSPDVSPGALFVAERVEAEGRGYPTDASWTARLAGRTGALRGILASSDEVIATPEAKAALHEKSGAIAVDTESHIAARLAEVHGLPFAALRAVADSSTRGLPPVALVAMKTGGGIDLVAVVRSIVSEPRQIGQLIAVARDGRAALRSLRNARRLLGPGLLAADLHDADLG